MKLTVQQMIDATLTVSQIIREARPMPLRGKYLLGRLHTKLVPEFNAANAQRDALIRAYDVRQTQKVTLATGDEVEVETEEYMVPPDKMTEFLASWAEIASEQIEIDVQPVPVSALDLGGNGSIEAHELIVLGDLITD